MDEKEPEKERFQYRLDTFVDDTVPTPEEKMIFNRRNILWIGIRESKKKKTLHEKEAIEFERQLNDKDSTLTDQERKHLMWQSEFAEKQIIEWASMVEEAIKWLREFEREHGLPETEDEFL